MVVEICTFARGGRRVLQLYRFWQPCSGGLRKFGCNFAFQA